MGFTHRQPDGSRIPALGELVPTHEFAFQVLAPEAMRFNEFRRFPLLKAPHPIKLDERNHVDNFSSTNLLGLGEKY